MYAAKNYEHLLGLEGFSDQLLKNHFTLYQGYVTNTNKLATILGSLTATEQTGTPEYAELKRRFGWEFNGMRLHELYFENMTRSAAPLDTRSVLYEALVREFGSYENWEKEFRGLGLVRGIGWAVLYWDPPGNRLFNTWVNEHDVGHLAGGVPLLVMDLFEHAYLLDYGLKRADYVAAFMKVIDWNMVMDRLKDNPGR